MSTPLPKLPGVTEQAPFTALDRAFAAFCKNASPAPTRATPGWPCW